MYAGMTRTQTSPWDRQIMSNSNGLDETHSMTIEVTSYSIPTYLPSVVLAGEESSRVLNTETVTLITTFNEYVPLE